jgi:hypothetical protein
MPAVSVYFVLVPLKSYGEELKANGFWDRSITI